MCQEVDKTIRSIAYYDIPFLPVFFLSNIMIYACLELQSALRSHCQTCLRGPQMISHESVVLGVMIVED